MRSDNILHWIFNISVYEMQNLAVDPAAGPSTSNGMAGPSGSGGDASPPGGSHGKRKREVEEEQALSVAAGTGDEEMVAAAVVEAPAAVVDEPIPFESQVGAELAFLKAKQSLSRCKTDVVGVVKPYVEECIRRRIEGMKFINIKDFQARQGICKKCFHPDNGHTRFECGQKCCDTRVCPKCFHSHYGPKCLCGHSQSFLIELRNRMI